MTRSMRITILSHLARGNLDTCDKLLNIKIISEFVVLSEIISMINLNIVCFDRPKIIFEN